MKTKLSLCMVFCGLMLSLSTSVRGQLLYSENFDDGMASTRWTAQAGVGWSNPDLTPLPMDTNFDTMPFPVDGENDDFSGFAFDYSASGIPSAPNSGGTTIGMKLYSSLFSNALGGFSANPNGLNLEGDYSVEFDVWASTVGSLAGFPGGGSGSTMLSTFGILTTGTASETILSSDGIFFASSGDGGTASDYRAYSVEDKNSYDGTSGEPNAVYHAAGGSRNGTAQLYIDAVGGDVTVPQSVKDAFPNQNLEGTLNAGATAFKWHHHEIRKVGNIVEWYLNDFKLITVDMTNFATPTLGGNISFGHADINFSSSTDLDAPNLLMTVIDNIEVNAISATTPGDFDEDGDVDGYDFISWQRGDSPNGDPGVSVSAADLAEWQAAYNGGNLSAIGSVPEPGSLVLLLTAVSALGWRGRKA